MAETNESLTAIILLDLFLQELVARQVAVPKVELRRDTTCITTARAWYIPHTST